MSQDAKLQRRRAQEARRRNGIGVRAVEDLDQRMLLLALLHKVNASAVGICLREMAAAARSLAAWKTVCREDGIR